jgi:hypothetical protein
MANVKPSISTLGGGAVLIEWASVNGGDVCEWASLTEYRDKTAQMTGTVTTAAMQGTNSPAFANPVTLFDVDNVTALTQAAFVAGAMRVIRENPTYIRPSVSAGTGVTVRISGSRR